jgi:hypothetical protein
MYSALRSRAGLFSLMALLLIQGVAITVKPAAAHADTPATPTATPAPAATPTPTLAPLAAPTGLMLRSDSTPDRPTVMLTLPAGADAATVTFVDASGAVTNGVGDPASGYQPVVPIDPTNTYTIHVVAMDSTTGQMSADTAMPLATLQNAVAPTPSATPTATPTPAPTAMPTASPTPSSQSQLVAPVLGTYPAATNKPSVQLTGTVATGTTLVVAVNGQYMASQQLNGMTGFSFSVTLNPNTLNTIQVQAQDANGNTSPMATATVMQSMQVPAAIGQDHVTVNSNSAGTDDTIVGNPGAAVAGNTVTAYADAALTQMIATVTAAQDGSFPAISLGDNQYTTAYVVQTDPAGNVSPAITLANQVQIANQPLNLPIFFGNITSTGVTAKLTPVAGATGYMVKYEMAGGQYSNPVMVCANGDTLTCSFEKDITGLQPGMKYTVAVAAVDQNGQESNYSTSSFQTLSVAMPVTQPASATPSAPTAAASTSPTSVATPTGKVAPVATPAPSAAAAPVTTPAPKAAATPTPTAMASPSASPTAMASASATETGSVKAASTTAARDWTPWIVLGILIGLAILATAGYFYWFGGEAGDGVATVAPPVVRAPGTSATTTTTTKPEEKPKDRDTTKRW